MAVPVPRPLLCPVLVGRSTQTALLAELIDGLCAGRGHTLLISGEAGIGKSRLVAEARTAASQRGIALLQGNCFDYDRALPYAPFVDLFRSLAGRGVPPRWREALAPHASALLPVFPELGAALPEAASEPAGDPEQEKRRLFRAIEQLLAGIAGERPVLLVVEDLHWSDESSLELLLHLARGTATLPLLLLLTYRTDEVQPALRHLLAHLDRLRLGTEVALSRLDLSQVETMVRATLAQSRPLRADLLQPLYQLSEGNPFFVEELLRSSVSPDGAPVTSFGQLAIPRSVQDAVVRRTAALRSETRAIAALAAVIGQRVDHELLQTVTGLDEAPLLESLRELIAAQLVVEESADRYRFRHALTRQALYSELLARERRALHRRIAEALEQMSERSGQAEAATAELAYHFFEANDWERAYAYARRAGERADALCAPRAAVEHFSRAIEAATRLYGTAPAELHCKRGRVFDVLGEFDAARADYETSLRQAAAAGDDTRQWEATIELGKLWAGRDYDQTGRYFRDALALARRRGEAEQLAHSLNRLGNWHLNVEEPQEALRLHGEALALFEQAGDQRGIAETLDLLGMTALTGGRLKDSAVYNERVLPLFEALGDRYGLASAQSTLAGTGVNCQTETLLPAIRDFEQAEYWVRRGLATARASDWRAGEAFALMLLATILGPQGKVQDALDTGRHGLAIATEIEHLQWMAGIRHALGTLHLDLLDFDGACGYLREGLALAQQSRTIFWSRCVGGRLASTLVHMGRLEEAAVLLDQLIPAGTPPQTMGQRQCWLARGRLALACGDAAAALRIADDLVAATASDPALRVPYLELLRGEALTALRREDEALKALAAGISSAETLAHVTALWQLHAARARVYDRAGNGPAAASEVASARAIAGAIAGSLREAELAARFLARVEEGLPRPAPAAKRELLSAREREVAVLVARGLTSRAIAEQLVLSERTVESHVGSILAKLGFSSRAQIAAWAAEQGLLSG